jgi:hypothetical protein
VRYQLSKLSEVLVERKEALLLDRLDALDEKDDLIGGDEDDEDGTK